MKKRFMQFAAIVLATAVILPQMPAVKAAQPPSHDTVLVGLAYGSTAMPGANLLNSAGSGYRFGYLDESRHFIQLGYTSETAVSAVKTQNVYYGPLSNGLNGYSDQFTSSIAVGCYHIQIPGSYASFEEASAAAASVSGGFPVWSEGSYSVRAGAYLSSGEAEAAASAMGFSGAAVVGSSSYAVSVVKTGTGTVLFQFDGGAELSLTVKPGLDDSVKTETWFNKYKYYGAFQFQRVGGGNITVASVVDMEDYVNCVLSREMSDTWPLEALKAQAVAVRNYCATNYGRHNDSGIDICGTTHCQVYSGCGNVGSNTAQAAAETAGVYVWYGGELAETYYFSCDGGATESAGNVWPNSVPYLIGKEDPYEPLVADKTGKYNWTVTFSKQELTDLLNSKGYINSGVVHMYVSETTPTGNVLTLTMTDAAGKSFSFSKEKARTILGLNSARYTVSGDSGGGSYELAGGGSLSSVSGAYAVGGDGTVSQIAGSPYVISGSGTEALTTPSSGTSSTGGSFTIKGSGWGHNVGMSQWGAYAMAQSGFTYDQILTFYYTGVDVR